MENFLTQTEKILQSSGCLTNTLLCAVINIDETDVRLMKVSGRSFIYLLCDKSEVVYAGRTRNLYARMLCHKMYKKFTDIILLEYSSNEISKVEKQIIKLLKPKLNKCWVDYGI
jgi:hypothetical protein